MNEKERKAKWHANQIKELSDIINELLEENEFDEAGFYLPDLIEHAVKLDQLIMKLI